MGNHKIPWVNLVDFLGVIYSKVGFQMNPSNTKIMMNSIETPIIIDRTPIQYCIDYIYLDQPNG